jgi:hypothetical protein
VCENRVLRRIFGPRGNEITGGRRKLHNELHKIVVFAKYRKIRLAEYVERMGTILKGFGGKSSRKNITRKT